MGITDGICGGFDKNLAGYMKEVDQVIDLMSGPLSSLNNELGGLKNSIPSPTAGISSGLDTIKDKLGEQVPSIPETSDIEQILKDCGILKGNLLSGGQGPVDLISKYIDSSLALIEGAVSGILDLLGDLVEAPVAFLINEINDLLTGFGFGDLLKKIDGLLNCLDSVCGTDVTQQIDSINNTLEVLSIDDAGNFDVNKLFVAADTPKYIKKNIVDLYKNLSDEVINTKTGLAKVGDSMETGIDKIIDANIDIKIDKIKEAEEVVAAKPENVINAKENVTSIKENINSTIPNELNIDLEETEEILVSTQEALVVAENEDIAENIVIAQENVAIAAENVTLSKDNIEAAIPPELATELEAAEESVTAAESVPESVPAAAAESAAAAETTSAAAAAAAQNAIIQKGGLKSFFK